MVTHMFCLCCFFVWCTVIGALFFLHLHDSNSDVRLKRQTAPSQFATSTRFIHSYGVLPCFIRRYEKTFWGALKAHIRHLYDLGLEGKAAHMD